MKALRTPGIAIATLAVLASLLVVAVAIVATHLDSAWVKGELARLVQDKKQRTLRIDGELALSVWPNLDLRLERVTLSERNSPQQFAALDSAHVSLQWLPLLSKRLVIDSIELSGLKATLRRDKDGRLNIADLLEPQSEPSTALKFDIAGIRLADGQVAWHDDITGQDVTLDGADLRSGRLGNAADASGRLEISAMIKSAHAPQIDARLQLAMQYALEIERQRYAANQLEVHIGGRLDGLEGVELGLNAGAITAQAGQAGQTGQAANEIAMTDLVLRAQGAPGDQPFKLTLATPQLHVGAGQLNADQLTLTLDGTALQGRFTTPLAVDPAARTLALERIAGQLDITAPNQLAKPLRLALRGDLGVNLAHASAAGKLAGEFDDSRFVARLDIERFAPPVVRFAVDVDRLDAARYQPLPAQAAQTVQTDHAAQAPAGAEKTPLSALPNLDLQGTLKIDTLLAAGVKARKLRLDIRTIDGELAISSHSAGPGRVR